MIRQAFIIGAVVAVGCGDNSASDVGVDGSVDTPTCVAPASVPTLEALASGDLTIGAAEQQNSVDMTVDQSRSVLFFSVRENEASPQYGGVQCALREADPIAGTAAGLRCRRNTAGTDTTGSTGEVNVHWTVATFANGVSVQRGIANTGFTNPSVITLSPPVDPASSFVLLGGLAVGGGGWGNNEFTRARLFDGSSLDIRTAVAGSDVAWQVVSVAGSKVQRGTSTIASGDTTSTLALTEPADFVLLSYNTDNPSGIAAASLMLDGRITGQSIEISRGLGGAAIDLSWEAVKLPFFTRSFTTTFAAGEAMASQPVTGLPAASSVALSANHAVLGQSGGRTDYDGADLDLLGEASATITVNDGSVTFERLASSAAASISWTVIDFAHDSCAAF